MRFISRAQWGAPVSSPASYLASTKGTKVHYLGSPYSSRAHSLCDDQVRSIRTAHLKHPTEGYIDIAYNALVCEHGYVFEGRGAHKRSGANGNGPLNTQHYAVCALLGSSGLTKPSDAMLHGIRDAIEWLRSKGTAGPEIKGHRDGWATACPGGPLYTWVQKRAPRPGGSVPPIVTPPKETDMPLTAAEIETIATRVWGKDGIIRNPSSPPSDNTHIAPATALRNIEIVARRNEAQLGALTAVIATLAAGGGLTAAEIQAAAEAGAQAALDRLGDALKEG